MSRPLHRARGTFGFTLLEMLVVISVIGVLLTIAAPTLRGAQNAGNNRQAVTSLANAVCLARTIFADTGSFANATPTSLSLLESTLTFVDASTASTSPRTVSASATATEWIGVVFSSSGTCYKAQATSSLGVVTRPTAWSTSTCAAAGVGSASIALAVPVSGAAIWLDGTDIDGDGYAEGDNENCTASLSCAAAAERVGRWVDKGTIAATVAAAAGSEPVLVQDGRGSRSMVRFDGVTTSLSRGSVANTSAIASGQSTTVFVVQRVAAAQDGSPFALGSGNPQRLLMYTPAANSSAYFDTYNDTGGRVAATGQTGLVSTWVVLTGRRNGATQELSENGVLVASSSTQAARPLVRRRSLSVPPARLAASSLVTSPSC